MARNSSVELLRILSMMMVLTVHFVGAAFGLPTVEQMQQPTATMVGKNLLEAAAIVGVNCFVLISGYYGIRASWKGLLQFTLWCLFASLFVYGLRCVEHGGLASGFADSLRIYSATDLWFVPAYFALYLLSPVLNCGLAALSGRRLLLFLAGLLFLNVYLGWFQGGKVNPSGYNVMQMVLLYVVGTCLRRFEYRFGKLPSWACFSGYAVSTACIFFSTFFTEKAFFYNSPFVLLSAVCLFMGFSRMKPFHSRAVNWVASSAFMVYLLHKPPFVWLKLRDALRGFDDSYSGITFVAVCLLLMLAVFASSVLVDKVRQAMFRPLFRWIDARGRR